MTNTVPRTHYETSGFGDLDANGRRVIRETMDKYLESPEGKRVAEQHPGKEIVEAVRYALKHPVHNVTGFQSALSLQLGHSTIFSVMAEAQDLILAQQDDPYSYSKVIYNDAFQTVGTSLLDVIPQGQIQMMHHMHYHWLSHERAGKRVYDVSPSLGEKLAHTELRGLPTYDLRLPFENIYLMVPESAGLKVWNDDSGWHRLVGVYITRESAIPLKDGVPMLEQPGEPGEPGTADLPTCRGWRLLVIGEDKGWKTATDANGNPVFLNKDSLDLTNPQAILGAMKAIESKHVGDALSFFRVVFPEDATLEEALDLTEKEMMWALKNEGEFGFRHMVDEWRNIFRWAMNAVLYATWEEPGEHWMANKEARQLWSRIQKIRGKKNTKRKKLQQRLRQLDPMRRIRLGHKIVVDRQKDPTRPQPMGREPSNGEGSMKVRQRIHGHWKQQPHGPKHSLRRYQWIEPYWRGPKDAPIVGPRHEMR